MKPLTKAMVRRLLIRWLGDVAISFFCYWFFGRVDIAIVLGACLAIGHVNSTFGLYQALREEREEGGDQ